MRKQHFVSPLDEWTGPFVSLLKEAARVANFTIKVEKPLPELQERSTNYFQSSSPNDYCIYNVALGNLDMCVSQYAITDIRLTSVEFLVLKTLPLVLVVQLEETSLYEDGEQIFEPFELSTWLFIVFFVVPLFGGLFVCHELDKYGSAFPRHHAVLIKYDEENVEALNGKRRPVERVIPLHNHIGRSIYDTFLAVLRLQYEKSVVTFGAHLHLIGLGFFILTITAAFTANLYSILNRKAITPKSYISFENAIERDYRFCTDRKIMQILVSHNPDLKDENFAIDPVDRRPGIMEAEDIVFRQLDPLLASENEEYCHAILTFRESLEAEQAFGRHCDKQIGTRLLLY